MAREISINKQVRPLKIDGERFVALKDWLTREITDAFSARTPLESQWRELMRMYEGVPKKQVEDFPIPNAPNIEITLGAIAADSIYAQATDLIWQTKPFATVRATRNDSALADAVKDLQTFVNWLAENEVDLHDASDAFVLDDVQLGTAFFYVPWVERIKKTSSAKVLTRGPRVR